MIMFCLIIVPVFYVIVRIALNIVVQKNGKFSYDGFSAAGFAYNSEKDIFYSTRNAWQKNFGYTHTYDVLAPLFRMIIDTEPVRFYYNNKNWLITFWKGQYGIVTGAEIGIYNTSQKKIDKKTIYMPVKESEMLDMELELYKNGEVITKVNSRHWWLAVFKLGMFSKPKDLSMDIKLTFPNYEMLEAFLKSFKKLKHKSKDYKVEGTCFYFSFRKPRSRKVWTRSWISDGIRQSYNRKNVELYNKYLNDFIDDNGIDESTTDNNLIMLNDYLPDLLKNSSNDGESKQVIEKIINKEIKNVIFLDSSVNPGTKVD